jgi:hypothetical protein
MANTEIDARLIKAIIDVVMDTKRFVVSLSDVVQKLRELTKNDGEAYRLAGELYTALSEGRVRGAYLLGSNGARVVVTPTGLISEQVRVLNELARLYGTKWTRFCDASSDFELDMLIDALIYLWTSGKDVFDVVYRFAKNNGLSIDYELVKSGIIPSSWLPKETHKQKEG